MKQQLHKSNDFNFSYLSSNNLAFARIIIQFYFIIDIKYNLDMLFMTYEVRVAKVNHLRFKS